MKMFIANTTHQRHSFEYRMLEQNGVRRQMVEIGGQTQISGDLTQRDIDYIVKQHEHYGLVKVDEVDRTKPYIGLCYSIDKPIAVNAIRVALAHNNDVLVERGKELRKEAALAVESNVEQQAPGALKQFEMTVIEDTKDGGDPSINEGVIVDRNFNGDERAANARRAARRGRG